MYATTLVVLLASSVAVPFDGLFTGKTLRFDYYHSGNSTEEHISLEEVRLEGDWPGSRVHLLDDANLGKYLFVVTDPDSPLPCHRPSESGLCPQGIGAGTGTADLPRCRFRGGRDRSLMADDKGEENRGRERMKPRKTDEENHRCTPPA